jgi:hypothetical protein
MEAAKRTRQKSNSSHEWIERELATAQLPDARLKKRLRKLGDQLSKGVGRSIPWACQDWAATKAAYRFFSNGRVREGQILASHFQATRERVKRCKEPILIVHDTTEFSYRRKDTAAVGID